MGKRKEQDVAEQASIVARFTIEGVPMSLLPAMCKELNINSDRLNEFLNGQTMAVIGNESVVYVGDIMRFIRGLPVID